MLVIDATVGGSASNSYNTESELDDVAAATLPEPAWENVDPAVRLRAMVTATRQIDVHPSPGKKASTSQALKYPREGLTDANRTTIPSTIKLAHALTTFFLAACADKCVNPFVDSMADSEADGLSGIEFGANLKMTFQKSSPTSTPWAAFEASVLCPMLESVEEEDENSADAWATAGPSVRGPCR